MEVAVETERATDVTEFLKTYSYEAELVDATELPSFFYPPFYPEEGRSTLDLIDHDKHPPGLFWKTTELLWKFKVSVCRTAPLAIFSSHYGSNMVLCEDIGQFYDNMSQLTHFKPVTDQISLKDLTKEINSLMPNGIFLKDLALIPTADDSIVGSGLVRWTPHIHGRSRAIPGVPIVKRRCCPLPQCGLVDDRVEKIGLHLLEHHREPVPRMYLEFTATLSKWMVEEYGKENLENMPTQKFLYDVNGGNRITQLHVTCPALVAAVQRDGATKPASSVKHGAESGRRRAVPPVSGSNIGRELFTYKGIVIIKFSNRQGCRQYDEYLKDRRTVSKLKRLIDCKEALSMRSYRGLDQICSIIEMTLLLMDSILALELKNFISLEMATRMEVYHEDFSTFLHYTKKFVDMICMGLIVCNFDRLVCLKGPLTPAVKRKMEGLFEMNRETKELFQKLYTQCAELSNHSKLPRPAQVRKECDIIKEFTEFERPRHSLNESIHYVDQNIAILYPVFQTILKIIENELETKIKHEFLQGLIDQYGYRDADDDEDGYGDADEDEDESDAGFTVAAFPRKLISVDTPHFNELRRLSRLETNTQDEYDHQYGDLSNWAVTSLMRQFIGPDALRSPRKRASTIGGVFGVIQNLSRFRFISSRRLYVPSFFCGETIENYNDHLLVREALPLGERTVGTVLLSLKKMFEATAASYKPQITTTTFGINVVIEDTSDSEFCEDSEELEDDFEENGIPIGGKHDLASVQSLSSSDDDSDDANAAPVPSVSLSQSKVIPAKRTMDDDSQVEVISLLED